MYSSSTVLFWDIRPQKGERLVAKDTPLPMGVPATFRHLDLVWRPFLKVHLFKSEPGGDHNPTCFSIQEHQGDRSIRTQSPQPGPRTSYLTTVRYECE